MVEFEIFITAYIIEGSLVANQIGYVDDRCLGRQFQTLMSQIMEMNSNILRIKNHAVEIKTLSTALGFKPRALDCRLTALTTELHKRPISPAPQETSLYPTAALPCGCK